MLARVPFEELQGLHDRVVETNPADRKKIQKKKYRKDEKERL